MHQKYSPRCVSCEGMRQDTSNPMVHLAGFLLAYRIV